MKNSLSIVVVITIIIIFLILPRTTKVSLDWCKQQGISGRIERSRGRFASVCRDTVSLGDNQFVAGCITTPKVIELRKLKVQNNSNLGAIYYENSDCLGPLVRVQVMNTSEMFSNEGIKITFAHSAPPARPALQF